ARSQDADAQRRFRRAARLRQEYRRNSFRQKKVEGALQAGGFRMAPAGGESVSQGENTARSKRYHILGRPARRSLELVFLSLLEELDIRIAQLPDLLVDAPDARRLEVMNEDRHLLLQLAQLGGERLRRQVQRDVRHPLQRVVEAGVD